MNTQNTDDRIAVDIVLIPPDNIAQLAIDINKTFPETSGEDYVLDAKTCIPHITLLMGLITREQLPEVSRKLGALSDKFSAINLIITHVKSSVRPDGKVLSGLEIEKTAELQKLHETILDEMSQIFTYDDAQKEMFFTPPPVNEIPMFWVSGFAKTKVRENYRPHITLGIGVPNPITLPVLFTVSRLALCHLGNYCTCRKILMEY